MTLRQYLNNSIGRFQTRRIERQNYHSRILVVPNHWEGSVQQFYHFLLGYFMPLCLWLDNNPITRIAVRDCGPMNIWFELLEPRVNVEIMQPGAALHSVVGNRMAHVVLPGMDDPRSFRKGKLESGRKSVLRQIGLADHHGSETIEILVIDRATSEDFYHGSESETHMSGRERRHVPNITDLSTGDSTAPSVQFVDFARISPADQINLARKSRTLVGQHGAGLVHMLWLERGSHVVEIAPPLPVEVVEIFEHLAQSLGHSYTRIPQSSVHSPVDLELLQNSLMPNQIKLD